MFLFRIDTNLPFITNISSVDTQIGVQQKRTFTEEKGNEKVQVLITPPSSLSHRVGSPVSFFDYLCLGEDGEL